MSFITELDDAAAAFYSRTSSSIKEIKKAMNISSRDIWSCDPVEYKEG